MVSFYQISTPKFSTHLSYLPTYYMPCPYYFRFHRPIWSAVRRVKRSDEVAQTDLVTPWLASCNNPTSAERVVNTSDTGQFCRTSSAYFNSSLNMWSSQHNVTEEYGGWNQFTYIYICNRSWVVSFKIVQPCLQVSLRAGLPGTVSSPPGGGGNVFGSSEMECRQGKNQTAS